PKSSQVETKSDELLKLNKDTNVTIMQANLKREQQSNEINALHLEVNRLKALNANKEKSHSELSAKCVELQATYTNLKSHFNKEFEAQNDLIKSLMKRIDDLQKEMKSRDNALADMHNVLQ